MDILFLLIPLGLVLVGIIAWFFIWSVNHRQFEDLEGPGHSIIHDDDSPEIHQGAENHRKNPKN
jgi:cbb3-type cytochrome oxidase maturation protein